jgi:two-component system response regulator AtoC
MEDVDTQSLQTSELRPAGGGLSLLVFTGDSVSTHPLPATGEVSIGRGEGVDIRIDDRSLSRKHAVLEVGPRIKVRDAGSSNGTRVRDRAVLGGEAVEASPGDVIEIGTVVLVIQRRQAASRARRLWTHAAFEARLEETCRGGSFALLRLHAPSMATAPATVAAAIASELGAQDTLAAFAPGEYEVLLAGASEARAGQRAEDFEARLEEAGVEASSGLACFPRDGRDPDALLAAAARSLWSERALPAPADRVVGDPAMVELYRLVDRLAKGEIGVVLVGETGVGKEVIAEALHQRSPRRDGPYLRINCAAVAESLFESELFGHEKGAFTGATESRLGLLEAAKGGSLFLDEIAELSPALQTKLLRALEEKAVRRVGATATRPIDVRFLFATNRNLELEVEAGRFRQDLFFRLGVVVQVPPLRERPAEIEPLARSFAARESARMGRARMDLAEAALARLRQYSWPGNIRELRNVMERAVLLSDGPAIGPEHLPVEKLSAPVVPIAFAPTVPSAPAGSEADAERQRIQGALQRAGGNQTEAAKSLGISRRTLLYRLDSLGLPRPRKRS